MASETCCNLLVIRSKDVDGEDAILLHCSISLRLPVQADEHCGRIISNAADRRDSHTIPSGGSVGCDDGYGGAELSHGRPKIS